MRGLVHFTRLKALFKACHRASRCVMIAECMRFGAFRLLEGFVQGLPQVQSMQLMAVSRSKTLVGLVEVGC